MADVVNARWWLNDRLYRWGRGLIWGFDRFYGRASKVGDHAFFDSADFPFVPAVAADWRKARAELDALMPYTAAIPNFQDVSRDQLKLTQDDGWKTFFFYAYGLRMAKNCERCPETVKLLKRIPGMKTAFFSILSPGKHLPAHRGPYKGMLRLHLGLIVPKPAERCRIRVGTEVRHWEEGKVLIFDDTFEHEVWNDTDGVRVVLFVDMVRPMRFPANAVNFLVTWLIAVSPFVLGAKGSYLKWERRLEDMVNRADPAGRAGK